MKWYFIRHGEILSNKNKVYSGRSDEPLTLFGRQQALEAGQMLLKLNFDAIFCSPLKRTRQTSEIIVGQLNKQYSVISDNHFNEIIMGPWQGMSEQLVEENHPEDWKTWNTTPAELVMEGRETLQQLQTRVIEGLQEIENNNSYESVLIVTHVAIIRVIVLFASRKNLNLYKSVHVDNAEIFQFNNLDFD